GGKGAAGAAGAAGQVPGRSRPKSMADTMEDIQLEHVFHDDSAVPIGLEADEPQPAKEGGSGEAELPGGKTLRPDEMSELGFTAALPQTGTLRPTLIIGLGSLGRRALMELRCRLLDRFGDLSKLPILRFLYVDTDKDALIQAQRGAAEISLHASE